MKCSKCGSEKVIKFKTKLPNGGYLVGEKCSACGHKVSWYVKSDKEKLESDISYHWVENRKV